jgi:hypothetical protein
MHKYKFFKTLKLVYVLQLPADFKEHNAESLE